MRKTSLKRSALFWAPHRRTGYAPELWLRRAGVHFGLTDDTSLHLLESNIQEAIRNWEPRVHEVDVKAVPEADDPGKVMIRISYLVRTTNNLFNQVYPFTYMKVLNRKRQRKR